MKIIIFFIIALCFTYTDAAQVVNKKRITLQQAESLLSAAMWHTTKNNPCVNFNSEESWISDEKQNPPRFSNFMIACRLGEGVTYYTIDTYTGDVLNPLLECSEIKNKKLEPLQRQIRRSLHLTQTEYKKIKTKGPTCDE
jgi:hypothetical protein